MIFLPLLFVGCKSELEVQASTNPVPTVSGSLDDYQLVVWPAQSTESDGSVRAYPVRLTQVPVDEPATVDFQRPVLLQGSITGLNATPRPRARLPGFIGPIDATLYFRRDDSLQDHIVHSDEDGLFDAWLVPGPQELLIRPDSALVPPTQFALDITEESPDLDIDLREFVPIWGRVTEDGDAKRNAKVRLRFADGSAGPTAETDADGWYELRVTEGLAVALECLGADDGIDPRLTTASSTIGPQGVRRDFDYAEERLYTLSARLVSQQGNALSGVPYRLRSTTLDSYPAGSVELTGFTDTSGNLVSRGIRGAYTVTLLMEAESNRSSMQLDVALDEDVELGEIEMAGLRNLSGTVRDSAGQALPGAQVSCAEIGFAQRAWTTLANDVGVYQLSASGTPLSCGAVPAGREDLAATRVPVDSGVQSLNFSLGSGELVEGTVRFEGSPEEFALVEVTDAQGLIWGTALTDNRGAFSLRIQPADPL